MPNAADRPDAAQRDAPLPQPAHRRLVVAVHGAAMSLQLPGERASARVRALLPAHVAVGESAPADERAVDVAYEWTCFRGATGSDLHQIVAREHGAADDVIALTGDEADAAARLANDLEFRSAVHARGRLFVHAAAAEWRGRAVLVPGRSFSGKSTLAAALLRAGAAYLSDEWAVLDQDGLVHPYPIPIRRRYPGGMPRDVVSPIALGWDVARSPIPVGLVVWTTYQAAARWHPERMSSGVTALALLDNAPAARRDPAFALRLVARAAAGATGLRGPRGDADETAARILLALRGPPEPVQ
jgi:hypothetical protein